MMEFPHPLATISQVFPVWGGGEFPEGRELDSPFTARRRQGSRLFRHSGREIRRKIARKAEAAFYRDLAFERICARSLWDEDVFLRSEAG